MIEIYPNLFIGSDADVGSWRKADPIVHACKEPYHRNALGYSSRGAPKDHPEYLYAIRGNALCLNLVDAEDPKYIPEEVINTALYFVQKHRTHSRVLVHCNEGRSRAPGIGFLYLSTHTPLFRQQNYDHAREKFMQIYPDYAPKLGMDWYVRSHFDARK